MARLAFFGTPAVAAGTLEALVAAGHDVAIVVTNPDRRRRRGGDLEPSAVKRVALRHGIPVSTDPLAATDAGCDRGVVVAFGRLIRPDVLGRLPLVNVHFSLLPRWRGAAPVERAILAGDAETGVCLMELEEGLDTGPVYACAATPIGADERADDLRGRLAKMGTGLLLDALARPDGFSAPTPQHGDATYAAKLTPEDLRIDFADSAEDALRKVRVGRAWTTFRGRRLLVHEARSAGPHPGLRPGALDGCVVGTAAGAIELVVVQSEGRAAIGADDWRRGANPAPAEQLGTEANR